MFDIVDAILALVSFTYPIYNAKRIDLLVTGNVKTIAIAQQNISKC